MGFLPENTVRSAPAQTETKKCGGSCKLNAGCQRPYQKPYGRGEIPVLFVGATPGADEDVNGKRLSDRALQYLQSVAQKAGLPLSQCKYTTAIRCRTAHDIEVNEIDACRLFLNDLIEEFKPEVIIPLGGEAITSVIAPEWNNKMGGWHRWVGYQIPSRLYDAWICPAYDFEYIVDKEDEVMGALLLKHLQAAQALAGRPVAFSWWKPQETVEILTDPKEIVYRLTMYCDVGGAIAFDYETTGLKPDSNAMEIVSNAVCWRGQEVIAYMMDDPEVVRATKRLLASPSSPKIASNMKFEERWTLAKMGFPVENWLWDTMLAAHVLDCRPEITSIKFQTYIRYGIGDYDSHIHKYLVSPGSNELNNIRALDQRDLLLYNGMDALLEYRVAVDQMRECGLPWVSEEYHVPKKENKRKNR